VVDAAGGSVSDDVVTSPLVVALVTADVPVAEASIVDVVPLLTTPSISTPDGCANIDAATSN
jgi:hypothetical protein